jgi:hypothetical protein
MSAERNTSVNSGRQNGRPRKADGPRVPYDQVDRLLVHGEVVPTEDGQNTAVVYPSNRDLARRYGCSHSVIAVYSKKHDCIRRRKEAQLRVSVKAEQKIIELRATALALSKDDALRMIDSYLLGFQEALTEKRVRFDTPTDFNTMLRLKEFILGGADSRQEIHAALSLEDIQARHQRMLRAAQQTTPEERGQVLDVTPTAGADPEDLCLPLTPPPPSTEEVAEKVAGRFCGAGEPAVAHQEPSRRAEHSGPAAGTSDAGGAPHGPNVARAGPNLEADEDETPGDQKDSVEERRTQ